MCDGEETTRSITPLIFPKVKIMKNQGGGVQMKEYIEDNEIIQDSLNLSQFVAAFGQDLM